MSSLTEVELGDLGGQRLSSAATFPTAERSLSTTSQDTLQVRSELPPVDRGRQAWLFVAGAFVLEVSTWGYSLSFGQDYYLATDFADSSVVAVGTIGTIAIACQYCELVVLVTAQRRYPWLIQPLSRVAVMISGASLLLSSFASHLWQLIVLQGVLYGLSSGAAFVPVPCFIGEWFSERKGTAFGIISTGTGLAGFIFPLVLGRLLEAVGWRWTVRGFAIVSTVVCVLAQPYVKPRIPIAPRSRSRSPQPISFRFLRRPLYLLIVLVLFLHSLAFVPVSVDLPLFSTSLGKSSFTGQLALAVFNVSSTIGQVGIGFLSDRYSYLAAMFMSASASAVVAFIVWGFAHELAMLFLFSVLFGGGFSSAFIVAASDVTDDRQQAGLALPSFFFAKGIASVLGPIIAGSLRQPDAGPSTYAGYGFTDVILYTGSLMAASSLAIVGTAIVRPKLKAS